MTKERKPNPVDRYSVAMALACVGIMALVVFGTSNSPGNAVLDLILLTYAAGTLAALFFDIHGVEPHPHVHGGIAILLGALVLPMAFASLYAFYGDECVSASFEMLRRDYLYFSYTTYTTLGYGEIVPIGQCRLVTSAQAMTGYVFMAYLAALFLRRFQRE